MASRNRKSAIGCWALWAVLAGTVAVRATPALDRETAWSAGGLQGWTGTGTLIEARSAYGIDFRYEPSDGTACLPDPASRDSGGGFDMEALLLGELQDVERIGFYAPVNRDISAGQPAGSDNFDIPIPEPGDVLMLAVILLATGLSIRHGLRPRAGSIGSSLP